jgi:hypothetical protein
VCPAVGVRGTPAPARATPAIRLGRRVRGKRRQQRHRNDRQHDAAANVGPPAADFDCSAGFSRSCGYVGYCSYSSQYGLLLRSSTSESRPVDLELLVDRVQVNLSSAKGFVEIGTQPDSTAVRAAVDVATAKVDLINAQNALRTARVALNTAMAIDASTTTEIQDNLEYVPITLDRQALRAEALRQSPEYRQAKLQTSAAEATCPAGLTELFPQRLWRRLVRRRSTRAQPVLVAHPCLHVEHLGRRASDRGVPGSQGERRRRERTSQNGRADADPEPRAGGDRRRGRPTANPGGPGCDQLGPGELPASAGTLRRGGRDDPGADRCSTRADPGSEDRGPGAGRLSHRVGAVGSSSRKAVAGNANACPGEGGL